MQKKPTLLYLCEILLEDAKKQKRSFAEDNLQDSLDSIKSYLELTKLWAVSLQD